MEDIKVTTLPNGRRQFYVDVGEIPADKVMEFVNQLRKQFAKQR